MDKSTGRQAKPQLLAVWWLLKQITAPGPRPRSSANDLAPPLRMGWMGKWTRPYQRALASTTLERGRHNTVALPAARPNPPEEGPRPHRVSMPPEAEALKGIVACLGGILA